MNPPVQTPSGTASARPSAMRPDRLLIGAPREDGATTAVNGDATDNAAPNAGTVYVFERSDFLGWLQVAYLKASDASSGAFFGGSVALQGERAFVGAPAAPPPGIINDGSGAVYVFDGTLGWAQIADLRSQSPDEFDRFGASVSVSGSLLAVGSDGDDSASTGVGADPTDNSGNGNGSVFVFELLDDTWNETLYIKPLITDDLDDFGDAVALMSTCLLVTAEDEDSALLGLHPDPTDNSQLNVGAVYVFR